jgi:hypothetical protein
MTMLIALTISISVLAVVATWLFTFDPLVSLINIQVWIGFIAWASHYHSGGKIAGTRNTIVCMSYGAVVGMVAMLIIDPLGFLGPLAAPVAVGLGAMVIVLAAHLSLLSTIPASVYGFASIAGLALLHEGETPVSALAPTIVSVVLGALFGIVSETIANKLAKQPA